MYIGHYDIILIFQHGGYSIAVLFPVSDFVMSLILQRSQSICRSNFHEISHFAADIQLLPLSGNKWVPCWNFTFASSLECHSALAVKFPPNWTTSAGIIRLIFQDGRHSIANQRLVLGLVTSHM